MPEHAFEDEGQAEGEEQPVEVVELVQAGQHGALDDDAHRRDDEGRGDQRRPEADAGVLQMSETPASTAASAMRVFMMNS